ncbi:hypothetical protein GMOD_00007037 [Pyrenophora seminiperda CCB06]|uniref:Uncharacterized protein n=1 Tax=Pyrenophora seminiperda CCB06 TaxID=1302712 RepID=A0A3M7MC72_9PLEO|nr:hypothetical protein GMOD_00007037 [Pyrenophora seminiperda CCB06]
MAKPLAVTDKDFLTTPDALCPLSTLASTEHKHTDSLLYFAVANVYVYVAELCIRRCRDSSVVVDEAGFIAHGGSINADAQLAIE